MNNATITINSIQQYDGDPEKSTVNFVTMGEYEKQDVGYTLTYEEGELTGYEGVCTHLSIDENKVSLWRTGGAGTDMVFEKDVRHHSLMNTGEGTISFCVVTNDIKRKPLNAGEVLLLDYNLEVNGSILSHNKMELKIEL